MGSIFNQIQIVETFDIKNEKHQFDFQLRNKFTHAVEDIKKILNAGYICAAACSFGKDSSCVLLAYIEAYKQFLDENPHINSSDIPFIVLNIDTGIENVYISMHVAYETARLKKYCDEMNWTSEVLTSSPPMHESWASLFLSAHKLPSGPELNNDCSDILKIKQNQRLIRKLMDKYGHDKFTTLVGSRLSESTKRAASIKSHNNDIGVEEALVGNKKSLVYMPIKDWSYEDVMGLLMRAGSTPVVSVAQGFEIPSYAKEHRILKLIYGEASDTSCPTSGHQLKGANRSTGCGTGSRFGCFLCIKSKVDKSATNQNKKLRYKHLQGNVLKIRDYIYFVSRDLKHRTFHSRAIDHDTGYVVLQPNVLKASTIEYIALQLMQATEDDRIRAERFRALVAESKLNPSSLLQDPGYNEIINDSALSTDDRKALSEFYLEYAQRQWVNVFDIKQALYLDAIHARDGVRLPPFRMLYLWQQVTDGHRLPYPNVNVDDAKRDSIPDAKFLSIEKMSAPANFHLHQYIEADLRANCLTQLRDQSTQYTLKAKLAKNNEIKFSLFYKGNNCVIDHTLEEDLAKYKETLINKINDEQIDSAQMTVLLRYRNVVNRPHIFNPNPIKVKSISQFTMRSNTKVKRSKGKVVGVSKGRTSVQFYKFTEQDSLTASHMREATEWLPNWLPTENLIANYVNEEINPFINYNFDIEALMYWIDYDGYERAISIHNEAVAQAKKSKRTRYYYQGTYPMQYLLNHGVLQLSKSSEKTTNRIIARTELFNQLGLFNVKDSQQLTKYGVSAADYRNDKAKKLLTVREKRNASRQKTQLLIRLANTDTASIMLEELRKQLKFYADNFQSIYKEHIHYQAMVENNIPGFDGVIPQVRVKVTQAWLDEFKSKFSGIDTVVGQLLGQFYKTLCIDDWELRQKVSKLIGVFIIDINKRASAICAQASNDWQAGEITFYWFYKLPNLIKQQVVPLPQINVFKLDNIENSVITAKTRKTLMMTFINS